MKRLVCFICSRSAKDALELARKEGWQMPSYLELHEMPCSGRVELVQIIRAFTEGADGVMIVGCLEGNCQFHSGNYEAKKRAAHANSILKAVGIERDLVRMFNISSNQGWKFPEILREMESLIEGEEAD